ncbi:DUF3231 family protein [Cytobacillus sp. Hz8]|uniref:DUF3231 family protein n=1 Tax=Cytobacillus sp. Hz8 TaxID=3347168 RepID=UPI0035DB4832
MEEHSIQLTTPEITALWTTYIQNSASNCFFQHFLEFLKDAEIKPIVEEALSLQQSINNKIEEIFAEEKFPIPKGFSDKDVDLTAPPLYTNLFALSFIYRSGQITVPNYARILTKVARTDVVKLFEECLQKATSLYKKSLNLMLSKGIYDRPPKIAYPKEVEFIQEQQTLLGSWFGEKRPLNTAELGEIFYTIERNYIGLVLLMGLIQVMKDTEIKNYLVKGKRLAEKQIHALNKILVKENHLGIIPVSNEVTDSAISPFSDRLIMFLMTTTTMIGFYLTSYTISNTMRKDLVVQYTMLLAEITNYSDEGLKIMINRGWMEQPPQPLDQKNFHSDC